MPVGLTGLMQEKRSIRRSHITFLRFHSIKMFEASSIYCMLNWKVKHPAGKIIISFSEFNKIQNINLL